MKDKERLQRELHAICDLELDPGITGTTGET